MYFTKCTHSYIYIFAYYKIWIIIISGVNRGRQRRTKTCPSEFRHLTTGAKLSLRPPLNGVKGNRKLSL